MPTEVPDLVPARMLNEYAYCPRLFFLEWVDQLWAPSADTAEGDWRHRRVDAGGGAAPLPAEGTLKQARSVELASERLGITATLDLVEAADGGVVPVDTKKGHPGRDGEAWDAAKRGDIFYAEPRQRVPVEITESLVARTLRIVADARSVATRLAPPPPLRSSPNRARCSLAGICLPDEVNVLAGREDGMPRRLIAADPDSHPLYVTEQHEQPQHRLGARQRQLAAPLLPRHSRRILTSRALLPGEWGTERALERPPRPAGPSRRSRSSPGQVRARRPVSSTSWTRSTTPRKVLPENPTDAPAGSGTQSPTVDSLMRPGLAT